MTFQMRGGHSLCSRIGPWRVSEEARGHATSLWERTKDSSSGCALDKAVHLGDCFVKVGSPEGLSHVSLLLSSSAFLWLWRGLSPPWVLIFDSIVQGFFLLVACLLSQ